MSQEASLAELRQKSRLPAKDAGGSTVSEFFKQNRQAIAAVLPQHMNADRMLKIGLHAMRATPKLMECTTESLFGAIVQCAQMGLEPNTVLGHAYLIPFNNTREKRTDVQLVIGYKGLIDLARRSGQIKSLHANVVRERDDFDMNMGTDPHITHRQYLDGDRGEVIGFYAVAEFTDGGYQFEFMSRYEVDRIRDGSQGFQAAQRFKRPHPWDTHYEEMGRKTVIRRLAKYLPLSIEFATATALDGMAEQGKDQGLGNVLTGDFTVMDDDDAPPSPAEPEPPSEDEPRQREGSASSGKGSPSQGGDEVSADPFIERMEAATSTDQLDEIMDEAKDSLSGSEQGRATRIYKRNRQRLEATADDQQPSGDKGQPSRPQGGGPGEQSGLSME